MENSINTTIKDFICDLLAENRKLAEALENANTMRDYWCEQYKKENECYAKLKAEANDPTVPKNDRGEGTIKATLNGELRKRITELEVKGNENNK